MTLTMPACEPICIALTVASVDALAQAWDDACGPIFLHPAGHAWSYLPPLRAAAVATAQSARMQVCLRCGLPRRPWHDELQTRYRYGRDRVYADIVTLVYLARTRRDAAGAVRDPRPAQLPQVRELYRWARRLELSESHLKRVAWTQLRVPSLVDLSVSGADALVGLLQEIARLRSPGRRVAVLDVLHRAPWRADNSDYYFALRNAVGRPVTVCEESFALRPAIEQRARIEELQREYAMRRRARAAALV